MAKKHKAAVPVSFYVCHRPSFDEVLNDCDRPLFAWLDGVPEPARTPPMRRVHGEIFAATEAARDRAVESCESGRTTGANAAGEPGVRVSVVTALKGAGRRAALASAPRRSARLELRFAPSTCPLVPFEVLHRVSEMGVNFHPDALVEAGWSGSPARQPNGAGAWAGAWVMDSASGLIGLASLFAPLARFESLPARPVFSAWVTHEAHPEAPADLLARGEPYDPARLGVDLSAGAGAALRYHVELENLDTGLRLVSDEVALHLDQEHLAAGSGHGVLDFRGQLFGPGSFSWLDRVGEFVDESLTGVEGEWCARVVVRGFHVPGGELAVDYAGHPWAPPAVWQHLLLAGTPYLPGDHIAVAEQQGLMVRTTGEGKAALRVIDVEAVPGIGVLLTVAVRNEFHVRGCVVVPLPGNSHYFKAVAVRNLEAQTESSPFKVLVPSFANGNDLVWLRADFEPYLSSYDTFPDGVYVNVGLYSSGTPAESILDRESTQPGGTVPIHALPVTQSARACCFAYLVGSERRRSLSQPFALPLQAPSGFVDVGVTSDNSLSVLVKFSVRRRSLWPPPVGEFSIVEMTSTARLYSSEAAARYGRSVSVSAADGYRCTLPSYVAFGSWSGGNVDELADYLIETAIKPFYSGIRAGVEYQDFAVVEILRPPYLLVNPSLVVAGTLIDAPEASLPPPGSFASANPAIVIDDAGDPDSIRLLFV